jgi:predicted transcriptional regulator
VAANELPSVITSVHQGGERPGKTCVFCRTPDAGCAGTTIGSARFRGLLECGFRSRTLRRHLRTQHGLERWAYYARWQLPPDHPIIAPGYSARRSALAKEFGLGRRKTANAAPPDEPR